MQNELKVGDTITCNGYRDMLTLHHELTKEGYTCNIERGFKLVVVAEPKKGKKNVC